MSDLLASRRGKTTILNSHRANTIRRADEAVVLNKGGIVWSGSADDYMRLGNVNPVVGNAGVACARTRA
jgi:ABC-type multidrug transport system fused ATPase/permease subunit